MSYRYEFFAEVIDGRPEIPEEILSRLRINGVHRVSVVMTSAAEEEEMLAGRGIDRATIDRVAAAQRIDPDVATAVLLGEGAADATELGSRLTELLAPEPE